MAQIKAKAILKNLDITPRKVRRVGQLLKGLHVNSALAELSMTGARSAKPLTKLIQSAIANAKDKKMDENKLVIESIKIDQGRTLKRTLPRGRGRATLVRKRFSHITVLLEESDKARSPGFIFPKKVKQPKEASPQTRPKARPAVEEEAKSRQKKGFMQKVFRRKAV